MKVTRRGLLLSGLWLAAGGLGAGRIGHAEETAPAAAGAPASGHGAGGPGVTADEALKRLLDGNRRFVAGKHVHPHDTADWRAEIAKSQHPFAVILGCADSRVDPELIFDMGLGDLFVIRQAGHVAADDSLGSIEYAVGHLGVPLVMVLGHEKCGAVQAALASVTKDEPVPGHVLRIVDDIAPAVLAVKDQPGDPVDNAVRSNIRLVVQKLKQSYPVLRPLVVNGKVRVTGAYYDLDAGEVQLLPEA